MRSHHRIIVATAAMALLGAAALSAAAGLSAAMGGDEPAGRRAIAADTSGDKRAPEQTTGGPADKEVGATVLDRQDVQGILGRQVISSAGEDMGRVIDVVVDRTGQVRAAVIDFGGFLGVGNRRVAVDWNALHFAPTGGKDDRIALDLTRDQVNAAPEYKDGKTLVVLGAADSLPY